MYTTTAHTKAFGISFICSFLAYGIGIGLLQPAEVAHTTYETLLGCSLPFILGGILVVVLHTFFNAVVLLTMYQHIKQFKPLIAMLYVLLGFVSTLMLAFGGIALLGQHFVLQLPDNTRCSIVNFETYARQIALRYNFYCYQFGMALWGVGGIALCSILFKHSLIPKTISIFGIVAYFFFIAGTDLELAGYPYGLLLSIPGAVFELLLSCWLIFKGLKLSNSL